MVDNVEAVDVGKCADIIARTMKEILRENSALIGFLDDTDDNDKNSMDDILKCIWDNVGNNICEYFFSFAPEKYNLLAEARKELDSLLADDQNKDMPFEFLADQLMPYLKSDQTISSEVVSAVGAIKLNQVWVIMRNSLIRFFAGRPGANGYREKFQTVMDLEQEKNSQLNTCKSFLEQEVKIGKSVLIAKEIVEEVGKLFLSGIESMLDDGSVKDDGYVEYINQKISEVDQSLEKILQKNSEINFPPLPLEHRDRKFINKDNLKKRATALRKDIIYLTERRSSIRGITIAGSAQSNSFNNSLDILTQSWCGLKDELKSLAGGVDSAKTLRQEFSRYLTEKREDPRVFDYHVFFDQALIDWDNVYQKRMEEAASGAKKNS